MSNGTSGDANCCDFVNPPRKFDRFTVGEDVAQAAWEAYQGIEYFDWVPIVMAERILTLPVRRPTREEVQAAEEYLRDKALNSPRSVEEVYARETLISAHPPRNVTSNCKRSAWENWGSPPCRTKPTERRDWRSSGIVRCKHVQYLDGQRLLRIHPASGPVSAGRLHHVAGTQQLS